MWNWTENQIDFYLIRHGATAANEEHRYLGWTEEPLSSGGRRMLEELAKERCLPRPGVVFCSPMQRCLQSAELLFPGVQVIEVPEWKEMNFGYFENKNYEELKGNPDYQAWIDGGGTGAFPGGEDRESFIRRTITGMERMLRNLSEKAGQSPCQEWGESDGSLVCLVHGGTIMALLSHYAGGEYYDYQVKNAAGYHCKLRIQGKERWISIEERL